MKIKKDKNSLIQEYTLHDSRIQKIEFTENTITLKLDCITSYPHGKEVFHKADFILDNSEVEYCYVSVFDRLLNLADRRFEGKYMELKDFINKYTPLEFEIIDEIYLYNTLILRGWLYLDKEPVTCMMEFFNEGDYLYDIFEEIK